MFGDLSNVHRVQIIFFIPSYVIKKASKCQTGDRACSMHAGSLINRWLSLSTYYVLIQSRGRGRHDGRVSSQALKLPNTFT